MPAAVYRMLTLLCALVRALPIGTNLGLLHLLWLLTSGQLLTSRGAVMPGLSACGLADRAIRRAWTARGQGGWTRRHVLARWAMMVAAEGRWQPHAPGGYRPVGVAGTGCWRPRLQHGPTTQYHGEAGQALPAIPVGLIARVGSAAGQRWARPLACVRADTAAPRPATQARLSVRAAVRQCASAATLVRDAGCSVALLQAAGATRYGVRRAKHATFRRATPPPDGGRGRPPTRGVVVRPLPRTDQGRPIPATPPDRRAPWTDGATLLRAAVWADRVLPAAAANAPPCTVVALSDPRHRAPLLLAAPRPGTAPVVGARDRDRWPVEHLPLAAQPMLGAARQSVHAPATCQRLPALALLAGSVLSSAAATAPAIPTGFWDRCPKATPGRLRRLRARTAFPHHCPLPARLRAQAAVTAHLPKGCWGQRRRPPSDLPTTPASAALDVAA